MHLFREGTSSPRDGGAGIGYVLHSIAHMSGGRTGTVFLPIAEYTSVLSVSHSCDSFDLHLQEQSELKHSEAGHD